MRILILLLMLITSAHADVTDGLVGWWKFDDGSGTAPIDSSGLGNNLAFSGSPSWVSGKRLGALSFNGSNTYVFRTSVTSLGTSRTVCFWFNTNVLNTQKGIMGVGNTWNENNPLWLIVTKATNVFSVYQASAYRDGVTTLSTGIWYFAAYTYNGSTGAMKIYLNAAQEYSGTLADNGNNTYLYIGAGYPAIFDGSIDDVRIYNRVLSETEIKAIYMSGTPHVAIKGQGRVGNLRMK